MESSTSAAACDVVRVGITGASGRLGALLVRELGGAAAPLQLSGGDETAAGGSDRVVVTIVVPFTFDVADYEPWAGTAGAGGGLFASAVAVEEEQAAAEAAAVQAAEAGLSAAQIVRRPHQLDLGDAAAVAGAFAGLDIVVHLAATIHADAAWDTVSRNNVNATQHVMAECAASGVRRLVFASTNHTQAAEFFTSLDPAVEGGMCALRSEQLHAERPLTTLQSPSAPDGFYALSKLLGEEMCKYFSMRHGLETVCLRIGWFKGGHLETPEEQLAELEELIGGQAEAYMRAMWLSKDDALQIFRAACVTENLPGKWPDSSTGPFAVAYAVSNNTRALFDLEESTRVLGYEPRDDYDIFAATLCSM